eukprot:CCRYP_018168-RA/>CCRYP_018168-RA protein AED:0.40 eAED:0.40 QI:0/0/0/1/0/0/2/0/444
MITVETLQRKPSKLGKTTSSLHSVGPPRNFPCISGARPYRKWNANSTSCDNPGYILNSPRMHTCMATTTTMPSHSCPLAWKPWYMTNHTDAKASHNTAAKAGCWTVWTSKIRTTRISASVFFKHKYITTPTVTPADAIIAAASNLVHALRTNIPGQQLGATKLHDLQRLQDILQTVNIPLNAAPAPPLAFVPPSAQPPRVAPLPASTLPQRPSRPAIIPDYDSEDDTPSPRVTIRQHTPSPRVPPLAAANLPAALHSPPALNTRSKAKSFTQHAILMHLQLHHPHLSARHTMQHRFPSNSLAAVLNDDTGELMEYRHLIANPKYRDTWTSAYGKELGRLAQGLPGTVAATNTIVFISKADIPSDRWRNVTYGRIVANFRPEKDDPYRIRLTVGGNRINFPGDCGTPTADMLTTKVLLNSVVSTVGARFMTIDIKDFYLNGPETQ